ncbi:MAG: winged helix-turn-helix transcriptional regulator [Gemmatimonadetes bacterium]|nr:winged helix-turn-helix transcriptional regulator [Gemmatimonadota bacterium]
MPPSPASALPQRAERNRRLYRSLTRTLREYNRRVVTRLHAAGFTDFSPAFPTLLSNLDVAGTPITVLARRAGVTRQATSQLLRDVERCGYARRSASPDDARVTIVRFTPRGRRLLAAVLTLVRDIEREFAEALPRGAFARMRDDLHLLADAIDHAGAFGVGDLDAPAVTRRGPTSRDLSPPAARPRAREGRPASRPSPRSAHPRSTPRG